MSAQTPHADVNPVDHTPDERERQSGIALSVKRAGIDTCQEPVIYIRRDCTVYRAESSAALARVQLSLGERTITATLHAVDGGWLAPGEAGLSDSAWAALRPFEGAAVRVSHAPDLRSLSQVRGKAYGHRLDGAEFAAVIEDVTAGRYADAHLAALVTACGGDRLDVDETIELTRAMIVAGGRLQWTCKTVAGRHCVGGLPANRTALLVVPIVAACGLLMPTTASRATASPSGTANTMGVLAPVDLDVAAMRRVVERTGGCIVWDRSARLSPAVDYLVRTERSLGIDSEGLLAASMLSKKAAAGSTHLVVDLPVGPTVRVRSQEAAGSLMRRLAAVAEAIGLHVSVRITDGRQPVGRGIGPALEARDALAVLRQQTGAPKDLRERALRLAGDIVELGGAAPQGRGIDSATRALDEGRAWAKFLDICEAQGGLRALPAARHRHVVAARNTGRVVRVENQLLAHTARLAGAPRSPSAGVEVHARLGQVVERGQPLYTVYADAPGELRYALQCAADRPPIFEVSEAS